MLKHRMATGFFLAALAGLAPGAAVNAKPADLPAHTHIECAADDDQPAPKKMTIELNINAKGITLKVQAGVADPPLAPALDAVTPALLEHWLQHALDALVRPDRSWNLDYLLGKLPYVQPLHAPGVFQTDAPIRMPIVAAAERKNFVAEREKQAKSLFDMADKFRRSGIYEAARVTYQRVHLLAPTTQLGRLAIDRLQEMEERLRDASEEEGNRIPAADPEAVYRDIRNGSMPLGLVFVTY